MPLTQRIFEEIHAHLVEKGLCMREGMSVDATSWQPPLPPRTRPGSAIRR